MKFLLLLCVFNKINAFPEVAKSNYTNLPEIFNITEIETCPDDHLYCKLDVILRPQDLLNPPEIWKTMKKVNDSKECFYRADLIYRTVCVERNDLKKEYDKYNSYGLEGLINRSYCFAKKADLEISTREKFFYLAIILYIILLIYCTFKTRVTNGNHSNKRDNKFVKIFSLTNTWKKIREQNEVNDKLLPIQGMRTLGMCLVLLVHSSIAYAVNFSHNPEYVEWFMYHPIASLLIRFFGMVVQIFFVLSSLLLAIQLKNIVKKNGQITMKDTFLVVLNRYCRLTPAVILAVLMHSSPSLMFRFGQPLHRSQLKAEQVRCSNGWLLNLFYIQNWSNFNGNICVPTTWYLAADTQLYVTFAFLFYVSQKFKIPMRYIVGVVSAAAVCLQAYTVMTTNFDGLLHFTPRMFPLEDILTTPEYLYSYSTTSCNLVTYAIGFVFGSIYVHNEHQVIFNTSVKRFVWFSAFFGFPAIAIVFYNYQSSRFIEMLMAVSVRPLFSLGIATGILGMITNTGGCIKQFFQWKPFVFVADFTYSSFMFHLIFVFGRLMFRSNMVHLSNLSLASHLILDVTMSFLVGMLMYIIFEYPCAQLQKMVIPRVLTRKLTEKTKGS